MGSALHIKQLTAVLSDGPADTPAEVFRRCQAADALGDIGPAAASAVPALARTLTVRVGVDCVQALRVAAARALWRGGDRHVKRGRVGGRADLALPHLIAALEDEGWGVARTAVETLCEMGEAGRSAAAGLAALAERRLASGPFYFEKWLEERGPNQPVPLLAAVAEALGRCGASSEAARAVLSQLAQNPDEQIRAAAAVVLAGR